MPYGKAATFHKGRIYTAQLASNQPNWIAKKKIFAEKANGHSILLQHGEYDIVNSDWNTEVELLKKKNGIENLGSWPNQYVG